jgi:hypothetical protein
MKHAARRTEGIRWDRWHRTAVRRLLEMLVINRVVRRAEVDPPRHDNYGAGNTVPSQRPVLFLPPGNLDEGSWFTRFFRRRANSSFTHVRHRA